MGTRRFAILAAALLGLVGMGSAQAFRCGNALVDLYDEVEDVLQRCGEPSYRYIMEQELIFNIGDAIERGQVILVEEWLYNFGPNRLMLLLRFEDERLLEVTSRGYGIGPLARPAAVCSEPIVSVGATQGEVLLKCGQPDAIERTRESVKVRFNPLQRARTPLYTEEWIYDPGRSYLKRVLLFRNNRLQRVFTRTEAELEETIRFRSRADP